MKQIPSNLQRLLESEEAAKLFKNKDTIQNLSKSEEVQKILQILSRDTGMNLQSAADAAMKGDPSQLGSILSEAVKNPEIAQTLQNLRNNLTE